MHVSIQPRLASSYYAKQAQEVIRACVHCGFCNATCPTYQELSDELDGPRGRIYLIKDFLEGRELSERVQLHLDRCLQCLSCETTCPSGVQYGRLIDVGKYLVAKEVKRNYLDRAKRFFLINLIPYPKRFRILFRIAKIFPGLLVKQNKHKSILHANMTTASRKAQILPGCVQSSMRPSINQACQSIFSVLGIQLHESANISCCGSVQYHLGEFELAKKNMRHNIDEWCRALDEGNEFILSTASGCSKFIKEYAYILRDDQEYADKAKRIVKNFKDISETIEPSELTPYIKPMRQTVAFHSPCTLQHGLKNPGKVEAFLRSCGANVLTIADGHLCCGSAGTYSILQKKMANKLRKNKLQALEKNKPDVILSANMACMLHLKEESKTPIYHWLEFVEQHITLK